MRHLSIINKITRIILVLSCLVLALSYLQSERLPRSADILAEAKLEPVQTAAGDEDLVIEKEGFRAEFEELYEYEVSGLVVEDYYADNWLDVTHKNDPFNTRDLCLIWGDNTEDELYDKLEFSHGEFTCFMKTRDRQAYAAFRADQLSNNHLIPATAEVARQIDRVRVGDQVRLSGLLVDLRVEGPEGQEWTRGSSVTRQDTGNGACELIYVTRVELLQAANPLWRQLFTYSLLAFLLALVLGLGLFVYESVSVYYGFIK